MIERSESAAAAAASASETTAIDPNPRKRTRAPEGDHVLLQPKKNKGELGANQEDKEDKYSYEHYLNIRRQKLMTAFTTARLLGRADSGLDLLQFLPRGIPVMIAEYACLSEKEWRENGEKLLELIKRGLSDETIKDMQMLLEKVKELVDVGADVNFENENCTPLKLAIEYGYIDIVDFLLDNNANPNALLIFSPYYNHSFLLSPLMYVVILNHNGQVICDMAKSLLTHGADVNFTEPTLNSVLMVAVANNKSESLVELLLEKGLMLIVEIDMEKLFWQRLCNDLHKK